jgi:hypothetical protein
MKIKKENNGANIFLKPCNLIQNFERKSSNEVWKLKLKSVKKKNFGNKFSTD